MKTLAQRRLLVDPNHNLSISKQCDLIGLGRSSYYYENKGESAENLDIMRLIDHHYHYHPWKGVPMMHAWLKLDQGYEISRNRVERLYYDVMGLRAIIPGPHTSKRHQSHPVYPYLLQGLTISAPMQVWATDITYIPLPKGFMYLTAVIDLYSRYVLNWSLSNTMEALWCRKMISQAVDRYGKPQIVNTDQGAQYTSLEFSKYVINAGIKLSMDGKGRATDNAFIERLWRTVKYENIRFSEYKNGTTLAKGLKSFFEDYNHQRRHSSIDYRFPVELFTQVESS